MSWLPCRGGAPPTRRVPDTGTSPSTALSNVDFPTPFGPRTATNSPAETSSVTPLQTVRPPSRTAASRNETSGVDVAGASVRFGCRGRHRVHVRVPAASAAFNAVSCLLCHAWNVTPAGESVSVTVVTGIFFALAAFTSAFTSGVAFWLL